MKFKSLYFAIALMCAGQVHAAFVVLDDPRAPAIDSQRQESTQFQIPFFKRTSMMTDEGLRNLAELKNMADRNDTFNLVIRQDADKQDLILANRRAANVKAWLQKRNFNVKNIALAIERPGEQHIAGNETISTITLFQGNTETVSKSSITASPEKLQTVYRPTFSRSDLPLARRGTVEQQPTTQATAGAPSVDVIKAILDLYKANQLSSGDTARLIAALYSPTPTPTPAPVQDAPRLLTTSLAPAVTSRVQQPAQQTAPQDQPIITTTPVEWVLEANSSLQENLNKWAAIIKWNAPIWDIPKDVELNISTRQIVRGDFAAALFAIQKACGLRIEYSSAKKTVKIQLQAGA